MSDPNSNPSQADEILAWLTAGHTLTQFEALERFGCMRLPSRIDELRHKRGIAITTTLIELPGGKRVAEYTIEKPKPAGPLKQLDLSLA